MSASGHTITITALGDKMVDSYGYSGPSVTTAPYNQQKVTRHYGFGTAAGYGGSGCGSDGVPALPHGCELERSSRSQALCLPVVPNCASQQQVQYGGSTAAVRSTGDHGGQRQSSVDTVTVTVGGKAPTLLAARPDHSGCDRRCQAGRS